jgi:hypothetical protein
MIDVQYTRALYSLSNRLRLACKIWEQTYIAVNNVAVFSSFLFADFIHHNIVITHVTENSREKEDDVDGGVGPVLLL